MVIHMQQYPGVCVLTICNKFETHYFNIILYTYWFSDHFQPNSNFAKDENHEFFIQVFYMKYSNHQNKREVKNNQIVNNHGNK